jgi:hypothetical protein
MFPFSDLQSAVSAANEAPDKELAYQNSLRDMYKKDAELPYAGDTAKANVRHLNAGAAISEQMANETSLRNKQTMFNQNTDGFMASQMRGAMGEAATKEAQGGIDKARYQKMLNEMPYQQQAEIVSKSNEIASGISTNLIAHTTKAINMSLQDRTAYLHKVGQDLVDMLSTNTAEDKQQAMAAGIYKEVQNAIANPQQTIAHLQQVNYQMGKAGSSNIQEWTKRQQNEDALKGHLATANREHSINAPTYIHNYTTQLAELDKNPNQPGYAEKRQSLMNQIKAMVKSMDQTSSIGGQELGGKGFDLPPPTNKPTIESLQKLYPGKSVEELKKAYKAKFGVDL